MSSFSLVHWIIFAGGVALIYWAFKGTVGWLTVKAPLFCTTCGNDGPTRTHTKGSLAIEIVLWLCLIVPGLIYTIWRHTTRAEVCSSCGAATVVPRDSPIAVKMRKDLAKA
jgi:hypothetical protein